MRVWLLRIATNAALDVRRRRRRIGFQTLEHDPPFGSPCPEHRLEFAEQCVLVETALRELSEMSRMVFHLRAQEDLSFREIAALVGTSEQGARWHMHQARTKLMARLAGKL
jgi:RNA polymerase sigma-70 factor (ECF subfamily)